MASNTNQPKRNHLAWIGPVVSIVALISYFTFFARFPDLRDSAWVNILGVVVGLGLSIAAIVRRKSLWSVAGALLSIACATLLVGYVFVLSNQLPTSETAIRTGQAAPVFELPDQNGRTVRLTDFEGSQLLVVFYRGFW